MFRSAGLAITLAFSLGGAAYAQTSTPAPPPPATAIVAPGALESGSNSFTEAQARERIERAGLTNVTDLRKDERGIWRGRAMRGTNSVDVGVDYRGNVAAQ